MVQNRLRNKAEKILHKIICILVVLLFGRNRISTIMADVAKGIKSFKKGMASDITDDTDNTYTFSELTNARHYSVYLNRLILRANEYSVSGTTVTLVSGTHDVGDELEVTGFSS